MKIKVTAGKRVRVFKEKASVEAPGHFFSKLNFSFGEQFYNPHASDLFRIGKAVFIGDRFVQRGRRMGSLTRQIELEIEVSDPSFWKARSEQLEAFAHFVSRDWWTLKFTQGDKKKVAPHEALTAVRPTVVSLFSQGLDSLCGAARIFDQKKEVPVFVSHSSPSHQMVNERIGRVRKALHAEHWPYEIANFTFQLVDRDKNGHRGVYAERSRRTRPFLYLSMAGATALELNVSKILLNENGVLAWNLPFAKTIQFASITRHAHPEGLRLFASAMQSISGNNSFAVENPFIEMNKADQAKMMLKAMHDIARETISCEYARQQMAYLKGQKGIKQPALKECGLCYPCLIRRYAMEVSGIGESRLHYASNDRKILKSGTRSSDPSLIKFLSSNVGDLNAFCKKIASLSFPEFAIEYCVEISVHKDSNFSKTAQKIYDLYSTFAKQYLKYSKA